MCKGQVAYTDRSKDTSRRLLLHFRLETVVVSRAVVVVLEVFTNDGIHSGGRDLQVSP